MVEQGHSYFKDEAYMTLEEFKIELQFLTNKDLIYLLVFYGNDRTREKEFYNAVCHEIECRHDKRKSRKTT